MPQQKPEIVRQLTAVQDNLAKAQATLSVDGSAPYTKLEPHMVAALAAAQQSVDLSKSRSEALKGKIEGIPAERITKILTTCRDSIQGNVLAMKSDGVPPNESDNLSAIMEGSCHVSKFAEGLARQ
jgi:hypothetical protein